MLHYRTMQIASTMHEEIPIFKTNENNRNPQQPGHHRLSQCAQHYNTEIFLTADLGQNTVNVYITHNKTLQWHSTNKLKSTVCYCGIFHCESNSHAWIPRDPYHHLKAINFNRVVGGLGWSDKERVVTAFLQLHYQIYETPDVAFHSLHRHTSTSR